jgi:hypothetical protein
MRDAGDASKPAEKIGADDRNGGALGHTLALLG